MASALYTPDPQVARELLANRRRVANREELLRAREALRDRYQELLAREAVKNPLVWGRYATKTKDEQDRDNPYKPFPDWEYFEYLLPIFQNEGIIFIKKSRTVMMSWFVTLFVVHEMLTRPATGIVFQSRDEDRAVHDIDYAKELWSNSIPELQARWPLLTPVHKQSYNRFEAGNASWAIGISGDPKKINSEHPSIVVLDEAALMERGADSFASALATKARLVICLSSAEPGWFEDYIEGARAENWPQYSIDRVEEMRRERKLLFTPEETQAANGAATPEAPAVEMIRSVGGASGERVGAPEIRPHFTDKVFRWVPAAVASPVEGIQFSRTRAGIAVVHVHYTARPDMRDPVKVRKERWKYPSPAFWEKEMEMRANALSGSLIYPEFDPQVHVIPDARIPKVGCRYMAIDPHPRTPHAFLWVLIDRWSDWYVYRELWPSKIYGMDGKVRDDEQEAAYTIREYVETVAHFEGNEITWYHAETDHEYGVYTQKPGGERIVERFQDQAGKAFSATGEGSEKESYWRRYERFGLYCQDPNKRHDAGEDAIRDLLKVRRHDTYGTWPRLHIAQSCPELALELRRLKYQATKRPTEERELKQKQAEYRCHLVDLLRYLASAEIGFVRGLES